MEKRKASYDLARVKEVLGDLRTLTITTSALKDAALLGFDRPAIAAAIRSLTQRMFYKSMTTHANPSLWQDVYHLPVSTDDGLVLYVKFQADVVEVFRLISFKEK